MWSLTSVVSGCGRFFEGTAEEMNTALNKTLGSLPNDTKVYVRTHNVAIKALKLTEVAWPRVHQGQRQIWNLRVAKRAFEETATVCRE